MVAAAMGDNGASFFSEPVFDDSLGEASWYADKPAVALNALPPGQRVQGGQRMEMRLAALRALAASWENSGDPQLARLGHVLEQIATPVQDRQIFIADGEPILAWWGLAPEPAAYAAASPSPEGNATPRRTAPPPLPVPVPVPVLHPLIVAARIFWTIVALTTVTALAVALTIDANHLAAAVGASAPSPGAVNTVEATLRQRIARAAQEEAELREQIAARIRGEAPLCPPMPDVGKPVGSSAPAMPPSQLPGTPLEVAPADRATGNIHKLAGVWRSTSGLVNQENKPVSVRLVLDADGNGASEILDGPEEVCRGPLRARFDGPERLIFEDLDVIKCPSGQPYRRSVITCRFDADDRALCVGSYGDSRFDVSIRREE